MGTPSIHISSDASSATARSLVRFNVLPLMLSLRGSVAAPSPGAGSGRMKYLGLWGSGHPGLAVLSQRDARQRAPAVTAVRVQCRGSGWASSGEMMGEMQDAGGGPAHTQRLRASVRELGSQPALGTSFPRDNRRVLITSAWVNESCRFHLINTSPFLAIHIRYAGLELRIPARGEQGPWGLGGRMKGPELRARGWRAQGREGRGTRSLLGVEQSDSSHGTFSPELKQRHTGRGHS